MAAGTTQTEEVRSGGSYLSQNDLRLHLGLGAATKIEQVEIHWPSGYIETMKDLAADTFYSILEGKGIVDHTAIAPGHAAAYGK